MDGFSKSLRTVEVPYDSSITSYMSYVPTEYPDSLEKGAYKFAGWYMDESYSESTKFSADNPNAIRKMPYYDLVLFAKWVPVKHNVEFYTDADFSQKITKTYNSSGSEVDFVQPGEIEHGGYIQNANIPLLKKDGLTFGGWFYYENDEKKAYDPANMPVKKELKLYPEWTSDVLVGYKVFYKKAIDEDGVIKETDIELAEPTTGQMYAGNSKVFYAKGQPQWYPSVIRKIHHIIKPILYGLTVKNGFFGSVHYSFSRIFFNKIIIVI